MRQKNLSLERRLEDIIDNLVEYSSNDLEAKLTERLRIEAREEYDGWEVLLGSHVLCQVRGKEEADDIKERIEASILDLL